MTREQRLVTLAFAVFAAVVVLALCGVVFVAFLVKASGVTATPPSHLGHISERMFADVRVPPGAVHQPAADSLSVLGRRSGERLRGAPPSAGGAPIPEPGPRASDAAVRGPAQTPAAATPLPAISRGTATWYDAWYGPGMYAAVGSFRFGDDPYPISVCTISAGTSRCATAFVRDHCAACAAGRRLVDLSPEVWAALDVPLPQGVMRVTVEGLR